MSLLKVAMFWLQTVGNGFVDCAGLSEGLSSLLGNAGQPACWATRQLPAIILLGHCTILATIIRVEKC